MPGYLATLPVLKFGWQKERIGDERTVAPSETVWPRWGRGVIREPRLRGLGRAGKGAVRPGNLDFNPTGVSGWCTDEILCIH